MTFFQWLAEYWPFVLMWLYVVLRQHEQSRAQWVRYKMIANRLEIDDPDIQSGRF